MKVKTDNKWKHFKYGYEVPKKVLERQFDWLDKDESHDGFIHYRNTWYHLGEFMRMPPGDPLCGKWDGYIADSFFSGVFIKISKDGEEYQIGTFYS